MNALLLFLAIKLAIPKTDATVGVAAIDLESGRTVFVRGDEPFPMASVYKFPLAITVLFEADQRKLNVDPNRLRTLLTAAVRDSDNAAAKELLRLVTPDAVNERMRAMHAQDVHVDTATPVAMTALLGVFYRNREGLSRASHDFLMELMTNSRNPVRIGKLLPKGCVVAHKTGTAGGVVNDAGIITTGNHHVAIAIFTKDAKSSSEAAREMVVAQIAREVYDAMFAR